VSPSRRALLLGAILGGCATASLPRSPFIGTWRQTQTGATHTYMDDGRVEARDAGGYPPPPPVHTGWSLIWRARADGAAELSYDGMPNRVVAIARIAGNQLTLEYSATNIHTFERIGIVPPLSGRWMSASPPQVYEFMPAGAVLFGHSTDEPLAALCCPQMSWRYAMAGYEIVNRLANADGPPTVSISRVSVAGDVMRITDANGSSEVTLRRVQ
jgi:hypothetical protein